MNTLERDLERTLRSLDHDTPVPPGLARRATSRGRRNRIATTAVTGVAVLAVVVGSVAVLGQQRSEPPTPITPASLQWTGGRVTVNHRLDDVVDPGSVIGVVDRHHVLVSPYGAETAHTFRLLLVDIRTGHARKLADIPGGTRSLVPLSVANSRAGRAVVDTGGEWFTGGTYVYVKGRSIHGLDVRTGRDRVLVAGADPWGLVAGDGMIAWRGPSVDATTYTMPITGGRRVAMSGVTPRQILGFHDGRLVAYDGRVAQVLNPHDGSTVDTLHFRRVLDGRNGPTGQLAQPCTDTFCVHVLAAGPKRYGMLTDTRLRLVDPSGAERAIPGDPVLQHYGQGDQVSQMYSSVHGRYVLWSTAGPRHDRVTSYLYDTAGGRPIALGRGPAAVTTDGWLVTAPSLTTDPTNALGGQASSIRIRLTHLPQ